MEMEGKKCVKCPDIKVDGNIAGGKQYDLDIMLPVDDRDFIYGTVKNCFKEPVKNAAVKLVEIVCEDVKKERRPVGHTFTDKDGEFVFGPLCPDRNMLYKFGQMKQRKLKYLQNQIEKVFV